jgi:G protein-coupled receptor 103
MLVMYNHTNQTETSKWTENEWMKFIAFLDERDLAEMIILIIFAICTILGNTLVLVATWRERSLHQPNKYFIACLAIADLLVGMILEPFGLYQVSLDVESRRTMSIHLCRFAVWIDTFAPSASIYTLTFISFDRYLKVKKPLQYRSRMTTSKSLKIIFVIWLISTAFATYAATPHSGSWGFLLTNNGFSTYGYVNNKSITFYTFFAVSAFFLPTAVILVVYALVFVVVHKRQKMLRNGELGQTCNDRNQRSAFLQDLKAIRMLLVVVGVFILCWGPYFIYMLLWYHYPNFVDFDTIYRSRRTLIAIIVINRLPFFNSLCNPIIYACLDETYRAAFKNLFQRMICRSSPRRRRPTEAIELPPLRTR